MEQDGLDHAGENLGHVDTHDLRNHLWEADAILQRLSLHEKIIGELMKLPDNLQAEGRGGTKQNNK